MRGIQQLKRKLKDGTTALFYRVQIKRKRDNLHVDRFFEDFEEAREFLLANMSKTGQSKVRLLEELKKETAQKFISDFLNNNFEMFSENYIKDYIEPLYNKFDKTTAIGKAKLRGLANTKSFFKTINNTLVPKTEPIEDPNNPLQVFQLSGNPIVKFGELKPTEINSYILNQYIKIRLKTVQPVSVEREIQHISNLFKKLKFLDARLKSIRLPEYDKDLLNKKISQRKRKSFRIKESDLQTIQEAIENYSNPELGWIISLMLHTGGRRAEVCLLTWEDVDEDAGEIRFFDTKNGKDRIVYMTEEARKIIQNVRAYNKRFEDNRLFSYTVLGFDGSYTKLIKDLFDNNKISEKITSHRFRKECISRLIMKAKGNYLILAEILGVANVENLEKKFSAVIAEKPETQADILKQVGHSSANITKQYYFSLK